MDEDGTLKRQLCFLIAKFLRGNFPEFANSFIDQCEKSGNFPSSIFCKNPSFEQLEKTSLSEIPDDQLLRLVRSISAKSQQPSLFLNTSDIDKPMNVCESLLFNIPFCAHDSIKCMKPVIRVIGHLDSVFCLDVDYTSQLLITGADDSIIKLWKIPDMVLMETILVHQNVISDIQISPDNRWIATSSHDFTIVILDLWNNCESIKKIVLESEIHAVRFSNNGDYLAAALEQGMIKIYNVNDNFSEFYTVIPPSKKACAWICFSPGDNFLAFTCEPCDICVFSMKSLTVLRLAGHQKLPDIVFFSKFSCGTFVSYSTKEKYIRIWCSDDGLWKLNTSLTLRANNKKTRVVKCTFNCDETNIVAISSSNLFCWDFSSKKLITSVSHPILTEHCTVLSMHPFLPNVAFVGCANGRSALWDTKLGEIIVPLELNEIHKITESVWTNDGQYVIAGDIFGGITFFGYPKGDFITLAQFFDFELDEEIHNNGNKIIYDGQREPLVPQPKRYSIADIRLKVKKTEISQKIRYAENEMLKKWNKVKINNFYEDDKQDEDNSEYSSDSDVHSENEAPSFVNSRMSTRHSLSIFSVPTFENQYTNTGRRRIQARPFSPPPKKTRPRKRILIRKTKNKVEDDYESSDAENNSDNSLNSTSVSKNNITSRKKSPTNLKRTNHYVDSNNVVTITGRSSIAKRPYSPPPRKKTRSCTRKNIIKKEKVLKNSNSDEEYDEIPDEVPDWCYATTIQQNIYIPQLSEEIYYLKQVHEKYSDECKADIFIPPYEIDPNLPNVVSAVIESIDFNINALIVTIKIQHKKSITSQIYYPLPQSPPVIIRRTIFQSAIKNCRGSIIGKSIEYIKSDEIIETNIVDIKKNWEKEPFEAFSILLNSKVIKISPWDIKFPKPRNHNIKLQKLLNDLNSFVSCLMNDYKYFISFNEMQNDFFIKHSLKPINLEIIQKRLENLYYQTIDELNSDVKQIESVFVAINRSNKTKAKTLVQKIEQEIKKLKDKYNI